MLGLVVNLVDRVDIGSAATRVGLVSYGGVAESVFYLSNYTSKDALKAAILAVPFLGGSTSSLAAALREMSLVQFTPAMGDRLGVANIAVLVTDGPDPASNLTVDAHAAYDAALQAKTSGIIILGVGVTSNADRANKTLLADICSLPGAEASGRMYVTVQNYSQLIEESGDQLASKICMNAEHSDCNQQLVDLVFVLDSSSTVGVANWTRLLGVVSDLVGGLNMSNSRVGVVIYAGSGYGNPIYLSNSYNQTQLMGAIQTLPYLGGSGAQGGALAALRAMRTQQFDPKQGDRPDVPNVAVWVSASSTASDSAALQAEAALSHSNGISILAVGVSQQATPLSDIKFASSHPHLQYHQWWFTDDFGDSLSGIKNSLESEICNAKLELYCRYTELGGYQCFCPINDCDVLPVNGTQCTDVNECAVKNGGCEHFCTNTVGSYQCSCKSGFTLSADMTSCEDVNECDTTLFSSPCTSPATCINAYGSYYCVLQATNNVPATSG
jgi:hypothetical protein